MVSRSIDSQFLGPRGFFLYKLNLTVAICSFASIVPICEHLFRFVNWAVLPLRKDTIVAYLPEQILIMFPFLSGIGLGQLISF